MSFETDLKKLQKMWDNGQDNGATTDNAELAQALQDIVRQSLVPNNLTINVLEDIGGDYIDITSYMTDPYMVSGFQWKIAKVMPEVWIPQIRHGFKYQFTGSLSNFDQIQSYQNVALEVEPVNGLPGIVTATWNIAFYVVNYDPSKKVPDFQAKLCFTFVPPSLAS
jgi:hypothetical protein